MIINMKNILFLICLCLSFSGKCAIYAFTDNSSNKDITLYFNSSITSLHFLIDKRNPDQLWQSLVLDQSSFNVDNKSVVFYNTNSSNTNNNQRSYIKLDNIKFDQTDDYGGDYIILNHELTGVWFDEHQQRLKPIKLQRDFFINEEDISSEFNNIELLQYDSLENIYFTAVLRKQKNEKIKLYGINIYEQASNKLLQKIENLNYSYNSIYSIHLQDINFDGVADLAIERYKFNARRGSNYDYYINHHNKFIATHLWGSDIIFNPKDRSAEGSKDCYDFDDQNHRVLTKITAIYDYHNYRYVNKSNSCHYYNFDSKQNRQCTDLEYNNCLLNRNNIYTENPSVIGEDNILYNDKVWYKGKLIPGYIYD